MLFSDQAFNDFFKRTVTTIAPYADSLVYIGGCANALYRHHPSASRPWPTYLGTMDVDLALPQRLEVPTRTKPLSELMKQADFVEEKYGGTDMPVIKYNLNEKHASGMRGAEIEFLCPLSGLKGSRSSHTPTSTQVQTGLYAQPLRYLELLLFRPWQVNMHDIAGFEDIAGLYVRIPNPSAYVMQKVLIREQGRPIESMAKDCYYIYEVSVIFRQAMDNLHEEFQALNSEFNTKWSKNFKSALQQLFATETSEGVTSAVRIHESADVPPRERTQTNPEMIYRSVQKLIEAFSLRTLR